MRQQVDGKLQSSDPSVYVVGDLAAFPQRRYGNVVTRQEHVQNARMSAAHAMSAIMAPQDTDEYDYLPYFYSRVWDLGWVVSAPAPAAVASTLRRLGTRCTVRKLHRYVCLAACRFVHLLQRACTDLDCTPVAGLCIPICDNCVLVACLQYYGNADGADPVFFGDPAAKKIGTWWVKGGKVVAGFLEGGSPDEQAAIKKVADLQPEAPSDLGSLGLDFASKL